MSNDDGIPECVYCYDDRGVCDRFPHLQIDRFFTVKLEETFDVCTYIPCHARPYVLEKLGFGLDDFENVETRRAHLRTKHGYEFLLSSTMRSIAPILVALIGKLSASHMDLRRECE